MKRIGIVLLASAAAIGLSGCERPNQGVGEKLDQIAQRLEKIEKTLEQAPRAGARRQRPQRKQPDPNKVYTVPIAGAPYSGPEHAKVTVVKAFEFACPFCDRVRPTLDQLKKDYGDDIKVVYKHYLVHPQTATIPAHAACAAHKQGKYEQMQALIWDKGFNAGRDLSRANMDKLAGELGLDMNKFKADIDGDDCKTTVTQDQRQLAQVGVRGTPAFFINGRYLSGARPATQFKTIIDQELKKANDRLAKGDKVEEYYDKYVVKAGLKKLE